MTIPDMICRFFLSFSHETALLPISLIGYTFYNRRRWGSALYILLFTMILAKFLKNIWQIPLPEHLGIKEYTFPSGHMQATVAFYGWVMLECRTKTVAAICSIIMLGVAFGLMHFGYHIPRDILGALGFAAVTLAIYRFLLIKFFINTPERIGILLSVIGLILIYQLPSIPFLWLPEGALVGFSIGWNIAKSAPMPIGLWNKVATLVVSVAGVAGIKFGVGLTGNPSAFVIFITYALVGLWIGVTPWLMARLSRLK